MNLSSVLSSPKGEGKSGKSHNDLFTYSPIALLSQKLAFTMAEILLSLTIIGVVAAITLPSLMGNINERTWNTQRKALHARMSQAIAMMPQLNGYGKFSPEEVKYTYDDNGDVIGREIISSAVDTVAEAFVTDGLSKVLKINNICDYEHLKDCGIPEVMYNRSGSTAYSSIPKTALELNGAMYSNEGMFSDPSPSAAAFETQNGESILVYYNNNCSGVYGDNKIFFPKNLCANFIYDLNGNKGPNTFGKDIGVMAAFYSQNPHVYAPMPAVINSGGAAPFKELNDYCRSVDEQSRVTTMNEALVLSTNSELIGIGNALYATSTPYPWNNYDGYVSVEPPMSGVGFISKDASESNEKWPVICIKR